MVLHGQQELWMASPDMERYDERLISKVDDDELPVFTVGIGGFVGAPFYLRAGKQGFPDGVTVVTQSEKGRQTETRFDAEPDLVFKHRHLYNNIRPRDPFWTFEREDWSFGSIKVLILQVLPRTIDRGFDGKGFIVVVELACIKPELMQALSADRRLLERLNSLSLTEAPSTPSTSIEAPRSSSTTPAVADSFDPLDVARRAREFRRDQIQARASPGTTATATQPSNRGAKHGFSADHLGDEPMPFARDDHAGPREVLPQAIRVIDSDEEPKTARQPCQVPQRRQRVELNEDMDEDDQVVTGNVDAVVEDDKVDSDDDDDDDDDLPLTQLIKQSAPAKGTEKEEQAPRQTAVSRRRSLSDTRDKTRAAASRRPDDQDDEPFDDADYTANVASIEEPPRRSRRLLAKQRKLELVKPTFDKEKLELVRLIWHRPLGELLAEEEAAEIMVADNPKEVARLAQENADIREQEKREREQDDKHREEHEADPAEYIPVEDVPWYIKLIAGGDLEEPVRRTQLNEDFTDGDDGDESVETQPTKKKGKDGSFASITFAEEDLQRRWQSLVRFKMERTAYYHQVKMDAAKHSSQHARQALKIALQLYDRWCEAGFSRQTQLYTLGPH
ncbi:hypothetical protein NDA16_004053 [Ustilago loliicola]|nr:hypothetical protein NDA16_004053 [Ustilago loliicola]